jgi:hypothetical protein
VIVAAALAVTSAADVLLALRSQKAWTSTLEATLITVPGLLVAWMALPRAGRRTRGRRAGAWDPPTLGVHKVIGGGGMPPYVRRRHDDLLDAVLDPSVAASRLVVVRGGSSTGKTRAAFEAAARGGLARWRLDNPRSAADLNALLDAGVRARTVLWLGELRDLTSGEDGGAAVLGRLGRLLDDQDHVIVVTTVRPEHWDKYMEAARPRGDLTREPVGTAGQLLAGLPEVTGHDPANVDPGRGAVVDVPAAFTRAEVMVAARADPVLADAADAAARAGQDGQLAQYLAGVPDLLNRYQGPGDRYGQAVIAAAMDAARLGCESLLPEVLLLDAAPGYLANDERPRYSRMGRAGTDMGYRHAPWRGPGRTTGRAAAWHRHRWLSACRLPRPARSPYPAA